MKSAYEIDILALRSKWREKLVAGRAKLKTSFFDTVNPKKLLNDHASLVDEVLTGLWTSCEFPDTHTLVAVGGYGRGELFPFSDVDILILLPNSSDNNNRPIEQFVGLLWDCGLEVGHSARTIFQCIEESQKDLTVITSLLEARFVAGDKTLFYTLNQTIKSSIDISTFIHNKLEEQEIRHSRYQDAAYNLEPNLKENPGGLRDLQVIFWISRAANLGENWNELAAKGLITHLEARHALRREQMLQNLRIRLHYLANRREDRLLFDYQTTLAQELDLIAHGNKRPSERLMQAFYRTAKIIAQLNTIVLQNISSLFLFDPNAPSIVIDQDFEIRNELLEARRESLYEENPSAILRTFLVLQQNKNVTEIGAKTLRGLWRAKAKINSEFRNNQVNQALFLSILSHANRVTFVLRRMNRYGILGRYLPAFGRIVGQMQHDLFHVYTVDAHILMVIRNLRRFLVPDVAHEYPFCSSLIKKFEKPHLLVIAALFHDIAKGRGGDHSQLGTIDARDFCIKHQINSKDTDLICWLVEQHLQMSSIAQKRDLSDPEVINAFASKVKSEYKLKALYLLTVADIRGTSPKVWNAWKSKLLEDLFRATKRVLNEGHASVETSVAIKKKAALKILRHYALSDEIQESLWSQLDDEYFQRFYVNDIAWHTRNLAGRVNNPTPLIKARLSPIGEGIQVLIYTPDQDALFARICNFFEREAYDIVDAKIYTTNHNYALDSFQILDRGERSLHYRDLLNYIEYELAERITKRVALSPPMQARLSRQLKHFPIEPKIKIENDGKSRYLVMSVIAGDKPGLLSAIAQTLVKYQISLHSAKITTLGHRAQDTLQVSGDIFSDSEKLEAFKKDLLEILKV